MYLNELSALGEQPAAEAVSGMPAVSWEKSPAQQTHATTQIRPDGEFFGNRIQ